MWLPWSGRKITTNDKINLHSSSFTFSTFKDVLNLCTEEDQETTETTKKPPVFHRLRVSKNVLRSCNSLPVGFDPAAAGEDKRIVVYFTSLRVVRKTFEDCKTVRSILRGFRVSIDERDLSMDAGFMAELQGILGNKRLGLPRVFIGGRYVGGADEIRAMHENGELKKFVEGFPIADSGVCEGCGGFRFVLCCSCNGSHKCYMEKGGGFRSCTLCNENGLIRCPSCCSSSSSSSSIRRILD